MDLGLTSQGWPSASHAQGGGAGVGPGAGDSHTPSVGAESQPAPSECAAAKPPAASADGAGTPGEKSASPRRRRVPSLYQPESTHAALPSGVTHGAATGDTDGSDASQRTPAESSAAANSPLSTVGQPQPHGALPPDIDALARAAAQVRNSHDALLLALSTLWEAVLLLPSWYFIAEAAPPQGKPAPPEAPSIKKIGTHLDHTAIPLPGGPEPVGVNVAFVERDGHKCLPAYTDEFAAIRSKARGAIASARDARQLGLPSGFATLELRLADVRRLLGSSRTGDLSTVWFNDSACAFGAPIDAVLLFFEVLADHRAGGAVEPLAEALARYPAALAQTVIPERDSVDLALEGALQASAAAPEDSLLRHKAVAQLDSLDAWWFVCNPRDPDAIYVRRCGEKQAVAIFSHERLALSAAEELDLSDGDGSILLLELSVADARKFLAGFRMHEVTTAIFDALTTPLVLAFEALGVGE